MYVCRPIKRYILIHWVYIKYTLSIHWVARLFHLLLREIYSNSELHWNYQKFHYNEVVKHIALWILGACHPIQTYKNLQYQLSKFTVSTIKIYSINYQKFHYNEVVKHIAALWILGACHPIQTYKKHTMCFNLNFKFYILKF